VRPWTRKWLAWLGRLTEVGEQTRWVLDRHLLHLEWLGGEVAAAERRLAEATADDPLVRRLLAQRGVGLVTAAALRAEVGRFDRFRTGKQLAHFCGLSPRNASSGARQADAGLVKTGNPELRAVLIELAHRLIRYDLRWRALADGLKARGKAGSLAAAAVANRWMRRLHYEMTTAA
jgi:transposase